MQNTGAVLSIAFVLAIVTSSVPKSTLFAVFSGLAHGLSEQKLAPFIDNMHVALWVLAATSLVGAFVCLLRPSHVPSPWPAASPTRAAGPAQALAHRGSAIRERRTEPSLRIGDVAKLAGTTPRTIRYYEEIGLLPQAPSRPSGGHRVYTDAEVERLREVMRLKDLLGVTLDELKTLLAAEESRAVVRAKLRREDIPPSVGASCWMRRSATSIVSWNSWAAAPASSPSSKTSCAKPASACAARSASWTPARDARPRHARPDPSDPTRHQGASQMPAPSDSEPRGSARRDHRPLARPRRGHRVPGRRGRPDQRLRGRPERPRASTAGRAILVIHEAGGLGEHIRDVVNRFANLGYVALGVDLYTREGGPPPPGDMQALMARLFAMSDQTVLGDLEGAADQLRAREDCDGKVGCVGFCMGGRYTLLFACASNRLDAAVDCWGGFIHAATPEARSTPQRPTPPLELAERLCVR